MTTNTCQGKMAELMALLENDRIKNTCGLDGLVDIAIQEHFEPALKDAGKVGWSSEDIEAWNKIFEYNITLTKSVLLSGLKALIEPMTEEIGGNNIYLMLNMVRTLEQVSELGDSLTHSWHDELKRLSELQEGGAR